MIGKTISHYRILEKLGEGGMGVVYKAEDTRLKRTVALKFLTHQALGSEEQKSRFMREAQAAAALDHPSICTVHEIDEVEGDTFISMAYIDGHSLREKIKRRPLMLDEVVDLTIQIAEGLQEAHEKEIVHRDIKSANIMVAGKDRAKIMDFGLAKLAGSTLVTKEGTTLGTVAYMSPEQTAGEGVDHRTDIWSLGVVVYEMITGQLPFKGDYEQAVVYSILNEEPESVTELRTGVPLELERIITKCLEKEPSDRYQNASQLAVDLRRFKEGSKWGLIPPGKVVGEKGRRKRFQSALIAGILVSAIVAGVIYLVIPKEREVPSVGVLYMQNLGSAEDEFWARGITEDVISTVASAGLIRVSSMQDVVNVAGLNIPLFDIARKLRVKYLLTSSIYKRDGAFDLRCQLIEAETGKSMYNKMWSEPVERASTISRTVAKDILNNLDVSSKPYVAKYVTVNPDAYELYLRGKYRWEKRQNQQDRELARGLLNKAIELDQNLIVAKIMLGQSFRETGDYERATDIFRDCLAMSERIGERASQALSVKNMADIYLLRGNYNTALEYYKESLRIARKIGDKSKEESILRNIGSVYYNKGDTEQALKYYKESLEIALKLGNQRGEGDSRSNLGALYVEMGDYDIAMDSYQHSLNIFHEISEKGPEVYSRIGIGLIYAIKGDFDEAINYLEKSLETAREVGDKRSEMYSLFYIGDVYYQMKQNDKALEYYQRSLEIAQSIGDLYTKGISHQSLGVLMVQENNYILAAHYFELACNTWKKLNDLSHYAWSLSWWSLSDLKSGNLESAQARVSETETVIKKLESYGEYFVVVNWNLFQVYSGLGEPLKAKSSLQEAYAEVKRRADRFKDPKDRKVFLDNVRENRDVISAYQQLGTGSN